MPSPLLLVVEDDQNLANLLEYNLSRAGLYCVLSGTGENALLELPKKNFDLVLLDIMLPGIDGFEVCRQIRQHQLYMDIPIIMLTAKGEEIDRVLGFELGIDDYIVKPYSPRELILRIRAVLKRDRRMGGRAQDNLSLGTLEIDLVRHSVKLEGKELELTLMEFKLLVTLMKRKGEVLSREILLCDVWEVERNINTRTIDTHVTRLREKLGDHGALIRTVRGIGYKLDSARPGCDAALSDNC
ncbi:MAG: response regulator transcription factor [Chlorobiaceae bacterium]|nr:response regulator transcription factor [Chlorobiaceae bacterium]NTV61317.1 response regulator transcription factor [Chlorobiaceae bacterium]